MVGLGELAIAVGEGEKFLATVVVVGDEDVGDLPRGEVLGAVARGDGAHGLREEAPERREVRLRGSGGIGLNRHPVSVCGALRAGLPRGGPPAAAARAVGAVAV